MDSSSEFERGVGRVTRREFGALALVGGMPVLSRQERAPRPAVPVALAGAADRGKAVAAALGLLGMPDFGGKEVYLKASFNSPDPYPATTHPEMLACVVEALRRGNCGRITVTERSGMGMAAEVWKDLGIVELARRLDIALLPLEQLAPADWRRAELPDSHWTRGVEVPGFLRDETPVVQICGAKTHRFGGVFSASLKNSIGLLAKYSHEAQPYNYMQELHASPDQGLMIAEANQVYSPALIILDAAQVFINGGPERGDVASPGIVAVSRDRVAIDAVAVSILRIHDAGAPIRRTEIFEHEQLRRAAELKLGAASAEEVTLLAADAASRHAALQIRAVLSGVTEAKKP